MADPEPPPLSCRQQLVAAVVDLLGDIADGPAVQEEPDSALDPAATSLPVYRLFDMGAQPRSDFCGEDAYTLALDLEIYAGGASQKAALDTVGLWLARAEAALLSDLTLGGLARDMRFADETPPLRDLLPGQGFYRGVSRRLEIDYATREADPFTFS